MWIWSFKENKVATYFAGRVCFVVYVGHMFFKYNEMRLFGLFLLSKLHCPCLREVNNVIVALSPSRDKYT